MKRYCKNEKPFVYTAFSKRDSNTAISLLQRNHLDGVFYWFPDKFSKKEIRRIEAACSCIVFISNNSVQDPVVRLCIDYAIKFNKKILCIYLEPTALTPGLGLLLNSLQSMNNFGSADDKAFLEKLKSAEVFSGMQVTAAQKRFAKRRGLASVLIPVAAAAVILTTVVYPLLIAPAIQAATGSLNKLGFGNISLAELARLEELNVVGTRSFDQWCYALYTDESEQEVYVNEIGSTVPTGDISDISDLALLKNVKIMTLAANHISDISPLYKLKNLEWLALNCNPITSIEGIDTLQKLIAVSVSDTDVNDITPLFSIPSLAYISFENTYVNSIEGIERLPHLLGFNANQSNLTDISPLSRIDFAYVNETEGFRISAEESLIKDFSPLQHIPKFHDIIITTDHADNILPYIENKYVFNLNIRGSDIQTADQLSSVQGLEVLYLPDSLMLTSLNGIEKHTSLTDIELMNCPNIDNYTPLLALPHLKRLTLSANVEALASAQLDGAAFEINYRE